MELNTFESKTPNAVDKSIITLEALNQKKQDIINEEGKIVSDIRNGFEEVVVMFIDMVDSTKFKTANKNTPEIWIARVRQFSQIVEAYVNNCGGRVVKYIGDELLVVFNRVDKINDAINLLNRMDSMQKDLSTITKSETTVKIALDLGEVFFLQYEGHQEPDPQGTAVDRCARIAKYCQPNSALTSYDFVSKHAKMHLWQKVGETELKGIGRTKIFQFGEATVDIKETIEIESKQYAELVDKVDSYESQIEDLTLNLNTALHTNNELVSKLKEAGESIDASLVLKNEDNKCADAWQTVLDEITDLKRFISESPVPGYEYSRFLFLHRRDESWKYSKFTDDTFDSSIEHGLVTQDSGDESYYHLDQENKRNKKLFSAMDNLESTVKQYVHECGEHSDDLFEYSLASAEFWSKYIGFNVSR